MKRIIEYLGTGLIVLGAIIVYGTLRAKGFNGYILTTGILLIVIPVAVYLIIQWFTDRNNPEVWHVKGLKETGIRIPVDLTQCTVKSTSWTTEVEKYSNHRVLLMNELSGNSDKNIETIESNLSRIEYMCKVNGIERTFYSQPIEKDNVTLKILLEMQKETAIYLDQSDSKYYYFDLEFLA